MIVKPCISKNRISFRISRWRSEDRLQGNGNVGTPQSSVSFIMKNIKEIIYLNPFFTFQLFCQRIQFCCQTYPLPLSSSSTRVSQIFFLIGLSGCHHHHLQTTSVLLQLQIFSGQKCRKILNLSGFQLLTKVCLTCRPISITELWDPVQSYFSFSFPVIRAVLSTVSIF